MIRFSPHLEILPEVQRWIYPRLQNLKKLGFVLYEGTALALQLGHRQSVDFDFFLHDPLDQKQLRDAFPLLEEANLVTQLQDLENTQTFEISHPKADKGSVKISFFGTIDFGRIGEPRLTEDEVLLVASPLDIFATKLKVIIQRPSTKDYVDIIRLIKNDESLIEALGAASVFFGTDFSPMLSLRALSYYGDLLPPLSPSDSSFLKRQVSEALRSLSIKGLEKPALASANLSSKEVKNL